MAGVTLSTLINATLSLYDKPIVSQEEEQLPNKRWRISRAAFPSKSVAVEYVSKYIEEIHQWYPFISLSSLGRTLNAIYSSDGVYVAVETSETERFELLMIFALTASHHKQDPYGPQEYYRSALDFLDDALRPRSLDSCNALLLLILYSLRSGPEVEDTMDCWLLTGHAVRLGIELGLTRNNYKARLTEEQHEARRRTWW